MKLNRRIVAMITALSLSLGLITPSNVSAEEILNPEATKESEIITEVVADSKEGSTKIQILATTDLHGRFVNYDYATASDTYGGLNQVSTVIKEEVAKNPNTIIMDNGDTIQGNYNHLFLTDEFLSSNVNPMVLGMTTIGYDAVTLGNHEFNYGMKTLNTIIEQYETRGTNVLCANIYKDGERVFEPYIIKEFEGVRVAIIGVVTNNITKWDADKLVGYDPTRPDEEVRKVIDEIKAGEGADIFIVSAHMGLDPEYNTGDGASDIAKLCPEVTMILAGHSHAEVKTEVNGVLIVQPKNYGQGVAKVELEVEKTEDGVNVVNRTGDLILINKNNNVEEDEELNAALASYHQTAVEDGKKVIGMLEGSNLAEADEVKGIPQSFVNDQGVTDLINEVQLYYSEQHLESIGVDTSNIHHVSGAAMLSATSNLYSGDITKSDLANIYKFDNKLYTIKTTGKQLKKYLEWTAQLYNTFEEGDLTISFNSDFASYKYDMLAGVKYEINLSKEVGSRIENLKFSDDKAVEDTDVIYLTVNDYRYSSNLAPLFDDGEHEKVYESTNDSLSDVRDMIADYITNVNGGTITRKVDNNWKLTGVQYNEQLREEVVKLINDGTLKVELNYGIASEALTWNEVSAQLTEKGLTDKLERLRKLAGTKIDVLTFNDFHGNAQESLKNIGSAKLTGVINSYQEKQNEIYGVIPVAAGDLYQGTAISNLTHGEPVSAMLKAIGIEASAIGNHEFDWDRTDFDTWQKDGGFDFVAANIVYKDNGELVDFAKPYVIVEKNGIKVAFIGIATLDTVTSTKADKIEDLDFLDPVETMDKWSPIVRAEGADVVVSLTHCSVDVENGVAYGEAADIATNAKDVDAVIGAHNHKFVNTIVNGRPVVQAGYNGRGLSKISFTFDGDKNLVDVKGDTEELYKNVDTLPVNKEVEAMISEFEEKLGPIFAEKVAYLEEKLDHDKYNGVTPLGVSVSEAMRTIAKTQISINNGGGIRRALEAGDVTVGDMYEILPFDNTIVSLEVTGEHLVKLIEHGINPTGFGWGQYAGIKVWYDEATGKVTSIRLEDGTKVEMDKYYSVAINDFMLTGGDGYDFEGAINVVNTQSVMRESIQEEWKANGIPELDYDLLIAGEDTTIDGSEDESQEPEVPVQPGTGDNSNGDSSSENLPNTGAPVAPVWFMLGAVMLIASGAELLKKKENKIS